MHHRSRRRGCVWKLTHLWTQRTRPQMLAKPQNGFAQAPTRLIVVRFRRNPKNPHFPQFRWSATHRFCGRGRFSSSGFSRAASSCCPVRQSQPQPTGSHAPMAHIFTQPRDVAVVFRLSGSGPVDLANNHRHENGLPSFSTHRGETEEEDLRRHPTRGGHPPGWHRR